MHLFDRMKADGHENVLFCSDPRSGYRGIIAVHSTVLGPAVGGTRVWRYQSDEDALVDALRLSRGMTYKCAMAGVPFGGGKAVIMLDGSAFDRETLFRAHGRFVERLGGRYITAEDVGSSAADMELIAMETKYVAGRAQGGGDPSPYTARGVFRAVQAGAQYRWGTDSLEGKRVAVQGLGNVGYSLAQQLTKVGARLIVSDIDPARVARAERELGAIGSSINTIHAADVDIFAPCALGGVLNDRTVPEIRAAVIAGAANNQLLEDRHGDALAERGIVYAPDYVVNAGGVLSGGVDVLGWSAAERDRRIDAIYDTVLEVFRKADAAKIPTYVAADRVAEERIERAARVG